MRLTAVAVLSALLAGSPAAAAPLPNPHGSAKPGVSYLLFRTDTVECGYAASLVKILRAGMPHCGLAASCRHRTSGCWHRSGLAK